MKKSFTVVKVETVAFDDQRVSLKSPDATIILHLHDQKEFHSFKVGDETDLSFGEKIKTPFKKVAKKVKAAVLTPTA